MSWQNTILTWALRRWVKPILAGQDPATPSRSPIRIRTAPGWQIRTESQPPLKGEWIEPAAPDCPATQRCILYFHGGGYIAMSPRSHRAITTRLAVYSNTRLFALDYRLAPDHPFPAALQDAVAAYHALLATTLTPENIVIAGDSAGGGLAIALLIALRDAGNPLPAAAILFSPWTDLAATGNSIVANTTADPLFSGAVIAKAARLYLAGTSPTNPLASPVYADLTGLPPMLVQVSNTEVLLDDSRRLIENANQAGVKTTLQISTNLPHVWHLFAQILPEGRAALRQAAAFISETLPTPPPANPADNPAADPAAKPQTQPPPQFPSRRPPRQ